MQMHGQMSKCVDRLIVYKCEDKKKTKKQKQIGILGLCYRDCWHVVHQGPVVQSVVSLTSSLRVILLTILADSIYNILIFIAEKNVSSFCTHIFSAKNFSIFAYHSL